MSACPTSDRLLRLLDDGQPEGEHAGLVAHLETCRRCRDALDRLAARSGLWDELPLLRDDPSCPLTCDAVTDPEAMPSDNDELPLGLLDPPDDPEHLGKLGSYDVIRPIGRGGMGLVFLARDRALDRLVAIKLLTPGMAATPAARRRFAREAKAAAAVAHEHVVTIHAVDTLPQGIPYLVMQYVAGKSVQDVIDRGKPPELAEVLRIGSQAAGALAAAHAQGLIHRDIKPANILLENGVERVKITDFGLARAVDDATLSQSGVVAGTPQYMSPEQAGGEPVDHRTDLFSLGSVLYALCTGRPAFRGHSSMATLRKVCEQRPTPIQELNPEVPSWLVRIIEKLHAKDPADRYGSAAEVADLLGRCLAHVQQPASVPLPAELQPARHRRAVALWGALAVGLILAALLCWPGARAAAGQAVSYVATVLRLKTPEGTLVIETEDPGVGIKLDGSELVITGAGVKELRLSVGQHNVQALKGGKVLRDELVTISRGGRTVLTVRREPENPQPPPTAAAPPPAPREERKRAQSSRPSRPGLSPPEEKLVLEGLGSEVRSVCFSPDGSDFAFGTKEGLIGITGWRFKPGRGPSASIKAHPGGVESVAFSPDGKTLVSGGWDHHVKLWDLASKPDSPKLIWDFGGFGDGVRSVVFNPDSGLVAAGGFDKVVMVLDATNGQRVWTSPVLEQPVNGVAFSPDGHLLALAMGDYSKGTPGNPVGQPGEVQAWTWPGRRRIATMRGWRRECKSVAFSSTGQFLAATSGDGTVRLYTCGPNSCEERAVLDGGPWTAGVAFRPGSVFPASSNWSGEVKLWDTPHQKSATTWQAHQANIPCIAFSPDGRYLATASADGSVKVWDVSGAPAAPIAGEIGLGSRASREVRRLADVLKSHAPPPAPAPGPGKRLYMRDLVAGRTTLIVDPSASGRAYAEHPIWSHDGRRILFHIQPRFNDWTDSRVIAIEDRGGRPEQRDLGPGCCASSSPDDQTIAFLILDGQVPGMEGGVWLMDADGTNRRRVCEPGAPSWSPDGNQLLLNAWVEPNVPRLYSLATKQTARVNLPGRKFYSWPRWSGPNQLVACIDDGGRPASLVLLDISSPSEAKVVRTLWNRLSGPDCLPRWPAVSADMGHCYFIGDAGNERTIYELALESSGRGHLACLDTGGPELSALSVSPDGRYLLFVATRLDPEPPGGTPATINERSRQEVDRLADALRRKPPRPAARAGVRMQLYMRDLLEDRTILIADEPISGLSWTGAPDWSHDGTRIVFDTSPGKDWVKSRLILLEARDGTIGMCDIGAGNCARFSPDDQRLAFVLNDGAVPGEEMGVYLMRPDGSDRRRIGNFGAPFWSDDGRQLLINAFGDPTTCDIYTLSTGETETISVPGQKIFSWPRWAGPGMLVACVGTGDEPDSIVLLDVTEPAPGRVVETLWRRGLGQDIYARWPLYSPATGICYFVGVQGDRRTLLSIRRSAGGRASAVEGEGQEDELGGLTFSPDGRYLLFGANRPDRAGTPGPVSTAAPQ